MKTFTIVGGINGVGKSSMTGVLIGERNDLGEIINVDEMAKDLNNNNIKAGKIAISKIQDFFQKGTSFTQETTLSGKSIINTVKQANKLNYQVHLFYVGLNTAQDSIKRIQNRVNNGGHNINSDDVIRRFNKRFEVIIKILPYCHEVKFYDNTNGFVHVADCYKRYNENGTISCEIVPTSENSPTWLNELVAKL